VTRRLIGLWALVMFLALLGVGTVNNQLRINKANETLSTQAQAGQRALTRQCKLLPVGRKLYTAALERGEITAADYDLVLSTATTACPPQKP
jgi:hypothetical protein